MLAGGIWWNDGLTPSLGEPIAQPPRVIGAVREQAARGWNARQQLGHAGQIMRLARRQAKGDGPARCVGQGMNLGRPSAARSSDGLPIFPPFPPDAERCALTDVLSALVVPTTPEEPDKT